jgi:hypothetical protein
VEDDTPPTGARGVPDHDRVTVSLPVLTWAEVCVALPDYFGRCTSAQWASRRDAGAALQEIDRVMRQADEPAPLDDLIGDL